MTEASTDMTPGWRSRLAPFVQRFVSAEVDRALRSLAAMRSPDGGWGRTTGALSEPRTTALALHIFSDAHTYLKYGEFEDGIAYLLRGAPVSSNQADHTGGFQDVEETALILRLLLKLDAAKYVNTVTRATQLLIRKQNSDGGWGFPVSSVNASAAALVALQATGLRTSRAVTAKGVAYLQAVANGDGGWGPFAGEPTTPLHTALAIEALPDPTAAQLDAALNIFGQTAERPDTHWTQLSLGSAVHTTALVLRALARIDSEGALQLTKEGVRFLRKTQNDDACWSWSPGEISEVEPTCVALTALEESGSSEYIAAFSADELMRGIREEVEVLRKENHELNLAIDAQVQQRIRNIIDTRDALEARVTQLEAENRTLHRQLIDVERLRADHQELQALRIKQLEVARILAEATSVIEGSPKSGALVDEIERAAAGHPPDEIEPLREAITFVRRELARVDDDIRPMFVEHIRDTYLSRLPPNVADAVEQFLETVEVPPTREALTALDALGRRVRNSTLRSNPPLRRATPPSPLQRLEKAFQELASADPAMAKQLVDRMEPHLGGIAAHESGPFTNYLRELAIGPTPHPRAFDECLAALADVISEITPAKKDRLVRAISVWQRGLS